MASRHTAHLSQVWSWHPWPGVAILFCEQVAASILFFFSLGCPESELSFQCLWLSCACPWLIFCKMSGGESFPKHALDAVSAKSCLKSYPRSDSSQVGRTLTALLSSPTIITLGTNRSLPRETLLWGPASSAGLCFLRFCGALAPRGLLLWTRKCWLTATDKAPA